MPQFTKLFHHFSENIKYFMEDLDFVDIICNENNLERLAPDADAPYPFKEVTPTHCRLSQRSNSEGSRKLISTHFRQSLYIGFIKLVYEETCNYLRNMILCCAKNHLDSTRLIGDSKIELNPRDILSCVNIEDVYEYISRLIFRSLENERNTMKLIEKFCKKINIDIDHSLIKKADSYFQIRHIFVHRNGIPDDKIMNAFPDLPLRNSGKIKLTYPLLVDYKDSAYNLIKVIDNQIVENMLICQCDIHGN